MNEKQSRNVFYIILTITAFCIIPLSHLKFDFDLEKLFPVNDSDVIFYQKFQQQFHTDIDDGAIIIGLENSGGIFQQDFLIKTDSLTKYIEKLEGIVKVYSLTNSNSIYFKDGQFNAKPLIHISQPELYPKDSISLFESKEYRDLLISKSAKAIAIAVFIASDLGKKEHNILLQAIEIKINLLEFDKTHIASKIRFERDYIKEAKQNFVLYSFISILLISISFFLIFRSYRLILFVILTIAITIICSLAFISILGHSLNVISSLLPIILIAICIPNIIYFTSKYYDELCKGMSKQHALKTTIKDIGSSTFLNFVAKSCVFFILVLSDIVSVRYFGLFVGTGILLSFFIIGILFWTYNQISPEPQIIFSKSSNENSYKILNYVFKKTSQNKYWILGIGILMFIFSGYFITKMEVNGKILDEIPLRSSIMEDYNFMEKDFYGTRIFEMALIVNSPKLSFFDKRLLMQIEEIETFLRDSCNLSYIISPISLFKGANKAYQGGDNSYFKLPETQDEINRYTENIMQTQYSDELQRHILQDGNELRISGRLKDIGIKEFKILSERFDRYFNSKSFSIQFKYKMTGSALLLDKVAEHLIARLLMGLLIAFLVISLLGFNFLRSLPLIFSLIASNLMSICFTLIIMGMIGIPLKLDTVLFVFISLVFIMIHSFNFASYFKASLGKGLSIMVAFKESYLKIGRLQLISTLVLSSAFLPLLTSNFGSNVNLGVVILSQLFFNLLFNLTLLPILFMVFNRN